MADNRKKVALVDIDGCLVENGKLNDSLIEHLKKQKYNKIILFTQRSPRVRFEGLKDCSLDELQEIQNDKNYLFKTKDIKSKLEEKLAISVSVCTSMDPFYVGHENVKDYAEEVLYPAEENILMDARYYLEGDNKKISEVFKDKIYQDDITVVSKAVKEQADIENVKKGDFTQSSYARSFYPRGKQEQYKYIHDELKNEYNNIDFDVEYYDDSDKNISEISLADEESIENKPTSFLVRGQFIGSLEFINKYSFDGKKTNFDFSEDELRKLPFDDKTYRNRAWLYDGGFKKALTDYVNLRTNEQKNSQKSYHHFGVGFFKGSKASWKTKKDAAEKLIKVLDKNNKETISFKSDELDALKDGRLGVICKELKAAGFNLKATRQQLSQQQQHSSPELK